MYKYCDNIYNMKYLLRDKLAVSKYYHYITIYS